MNTPTLLPAAPVPGSIFAVTAATTTSCSAFVGHRRVAQGSYADIVVALSGYDVAGDTVLVFDDATSALLDVPSGPAAQARAEGSQPASNAANLETGPPDATPQDATPAPPAVGRPKLGVVAREVTLLPRHWEWLATQSGGASAALRRLVEEARRSHAALDRQRAAKDRTFRFINAVAGNLAGFEEAARLLFADDESAFAKHIAAWPQDVRAHSLALAQGGFPEEASAD